MQVKATMRCHFTPTRMATVKKKKKLRKKLQVLIRIQRNHNLSTVVSMLNSAML